MASRETELTHRQRHPCSLGPCLLTPAPREGGPCFPCLSRRGSSRVKAHGTPGHSCGAQSPWKPGSPLGTAAIPGSGGRVRWTLHGGAGGQDGEGTHAPAGPTPPAGSRRHHKQPPHRSLCPGLSSSRATPVQSTSPPAQQTDDICRRQTRTKLPSPRILVVRRTRVSAVSF